MASILMTYTKHLVLLTILYLVCASLTALCIEFEVGGEDGWAVPSSRNSQRYNHWASMNRFNVGDTIRFMYRKDSVMEVDKKEYEKCRSAHPRFFSNNGDTVYNLTHSGTFYFISGVTGHCDRGEKMIIKVISHSDAPTVSPPSPDKSNANTLLSMAIASILAVLQYLCRKVYVGDGEYGRYSGAEAVDGDDSLSTMDLRQEMAKDRLLMVMNKPTLDPLQAT